jgi:hypothetical protein
VSFTVEGFGGHPVTEFLRAGGEAAAKLADAAVWSLPDGELVDLVTAAARLESQVAALKLQLIGEADGRGVAGRAGAPSTQAWLRHRLHCRPGDAKRDVVLAAALQRLPVAARALGEGRISIGHLRVIAGAVAGLPADTGLVAGGADGGAGHAGLGDAGLRDAGPGDAGPGDAGLGDAGPGDAGVGDRGRGDAGVGGAGVGDGGVAGSSPGGVRRRAEAHLVARAQVFDPHRLAVLGRRILEVVDPDAADAQEAEKLAELERRAFRRRELRFSPDGHGSVLVTGRLDAESAAVIGRALDPFARPLPSADGRPDLRTPGARLADAWVETSRRVLSAGELPAQRGELPQIVITIDHAKLRQQVGCGILDTGQQLSPAAVRRIACDAEILPAVLGGNSQTLDLGRRQRLFSPAQRRALILRDRGCAFPGCDRPPAWCEAHHVKHWITGGATDLNNAVLLCGFHHRVIHHGHWCVNIAPDGIPELPPPRYIDPQRRPIRKRTPQPT